MANRLVIKYLEIDENDKVVREWQQPIIMEQEHHPYHPHQCNCECGDNDDPIDEPPVIEEYYYYNNDGIGSEHIDENNLEHIQTKWDVQFNPNIDYTNVYPLLIITAQSPLPVEGEDPMFIIPSNQLALLNSQTQNHQNISVVKQDNNQYFVTFAVQEGNPVKIYENNVETTNDWLVISGSTYLAYVKEFNTSIPELKLVLAGGQEEVEANYYYNGGGIGSEHIDPANHAFGIQLELEVDPNLDYLGYDYMFRVTPEFQDPTQNSFTGEFLCNVGMGATSHTETNQVIKTIDDTYVVKFAGPANPLYIHPTWYKYEQVYQIFENGVDKTSDYTVTVWPNGQLQVFEKKFTNVEHLPNFKLKTIGHRVDILEFVATTNSNNKINIELELQNALSVDWGDGFIGTTQAENANHIYANPGTYTIKVKKGLVADKDNILFRHVVTTNLVSITKFYDIAKSIVFFYPTGGQKLLTSAQVNDILIQLDNNTPSLLNYVSFQSIDLLTLSSAALTAKTNLEAKGVRVNISM